MPIKSFKRFALYIANFMVEDEHTRQTPSKNNFTPVVGVNPNSLEHDPIGDQYRLACYTGNLCPMARAFLYRLNGCNLDITGLVSALEFYTPGILVSHVVLDLRFYLRKLGMAGQAHHTTAITVELAV